jgi:proprotein convertase subtilisin/kexin type 5
MYLHIDGTCVYDCPSGYYEDSSTMTCLPCVAPCATCESATHCNSCIENWFLYGTTCVDECPQDEGYYDNVGTWTCDECSYPCETCSEPVADETECQACVEADDCAGDSFCCP